MLPKQITTDADEKGVLINANQGSRQVKILTGNGEYQIHDAGDSKIIRLEVYGNIVTVTGRKAGETSSYFNRCQETDIPTYSCSNSAGKALVYEFRQRLCSLTHFGEMTGDGLESIKAATNDFKLKR